MPRRFFLRPLTVSVLSVLGIALTAGEKANAQAIITQTHKLTANDGVANDDFGLSVALSGTNGIVGAWQNPRFANGAAYIFDTTTGQQTMKLVASDGAVQDQFGFAVSLLGTTALVSAPLADINGNGDQGSAYLFNATTGQQLFKLTASDGASGDFFGYRGAALSGNLALISADADDIGGNIDQGSAYLFNATTGQQLFKLTSSDGATNDEFGSSVALSGTTALVGAYQFQNPTGKGAAYVFDGTTGQQVRKLTASDGVIGDQFGISVSLSGNLALVGSYWATVGGNARQGAAYLFDVTTGQQLFKFTASDGTADNGFGGSVALSGNLALISSNADGVNGAGAAYVFNTFTGQQVGKFSSSDGAFGDGFGWSVALAGDTALVGAAFADVSGRVDQGAAYTFTITSAPEPGSLTLLALALPIWCRRKRTLNL